METVLESDSEEQVRGGETREEEEEERWTGVEGTLSKFHVSALQIYFYFSLVYYINLSGTMWQNIHLIQRSKDKGPVAILGWHRNH